MENIYISEQDEPAFRVRCPVHGFIRFSPNERKLIDHPLFQRLRNIRQLALTYYVYPGALHSRFEHSLGVMELVSRAFDSLCRTKENRDLITSKFSDVPEFKDKPLPKARQVLRLAALLHDTGHTPFSHAGEMLAPEGSHEIITTTIIKEPAFLGTLIEETFWTGILEWIAKLIVDDAKNPLPPQFYLLKQLISFQMDFDRTDYLIRDSLYCGVDYGRFDYKRLLESLAVRKSAETEGLEIAIDKGGWHVFEALILARYQMNTQVYFHRVRRIYDYYISQYVNSLVDSGVVKPEINEVLKHDDLSMLTKMKKDIDSDNPEIKKYAERIIMRRHHKLIFEVGDHADANDLKKLKIMYNTLKNENAGIDFFLDDGKGSIHELFVEGEEEIKEDLFVVDKTSSTEERLTEKSKIISKIPKNFRVVRIFADIDEAEQRGKIMAKARELYNGRGER